MHHHCLLAAWCITLSAFNTPAVHFLLLSPLCHGGGDHAVPITLAAAQMCVFGPIGGEGVRDGLHKRNLTTKLRLLHDLVAHI